MPPESITRSDTFRLRAQKSEQVRTRLMLAVCGLLLLLAWVRRELGGVVMSNNLVFELTAGILGAAIAYEAWFLDVLRRANREGRLLAEWRWKANAAIEMAIPIAILTVLHFRSPLGEVDALSPPVILLIPIIILLSVLRLRPRFTLWMGLAAAAAHALLVSRTIIDVHEPASHAPVLYSYTGMLAIAAVAGALVARAARRYVQEAADEAVAREADRRRLESIEHDLGIAREIQRDLLPRSSPDVAGFDLAGFNRPADLTGGDYYDWQPLPDGRLAIVLADVTGHGIGPALVMAVCRAYARASAPLIQSPGALLERLNTLVHEDVRGGRFITLVLAILDPRTGRTELASAGHGPTFLYRAADRSVRQFGGDGMPLGIDPDERYGQCNILELGPGDILLMMTDGFFEWQRPSDNQAFGPARIEEVLRAQASRPAAAIVEAIDQAVREFSEGSRQIDDTTAVALKHVPG